MHLGCQFINCACSLNALGLDLTGGAFDFCLRGSLIFGMPRINLIVFPLTYILLFTAMMLHSDNWLPSIETVVNID
jgi:hypothetical protein